MKNGEGNYQAAHHPLTFIKCPLDARYLHNSPHETHNPFLTPSGLLVLNICLFYEEDGEREREICHLLIHSPNAQSFRPNQASARSWGVLLPHCVGET